MNDQVKDDNEFYTDDEIKELAEEVVNDKIEDLKREINPWAPSLTWVQIALALAAGAIGASGHDGWGWCLFILGLTLLD